MTDKHTPTARPLLDKLKIIETFLKENKLGGFAGTVSRTIDELELHYEYDKERRWLSTRYNDLKKSAYRDHPEAVFMGLRDAEFNPIPNAAQSNYFNNVMAAWDKYSKAVNAYDDLMKLVEAVEDILDAINKPFVGGFEADMKNIEKGRDAKFALETAVNKVKPK